MRMMIIAMTDDSRVGQDYYHDAVDNSDVGCNGTLMLDNTARRQAWHR